MSITAAESKAFSLQQIDKSDWPTYKFGDIAFNISERVEPQATELDIYVGLEHLVPGDIHIRRKGTPADVEGTKLKVYKGDVIFGKRRAYQRKAAIADFDGICSAHAMVIRANPENIDPNLFPFFLHSDAFMHRAVEISEGSLSPTIKWKILKEQEFKLPPWPLQKKIVDVLVCVDFLQEKLRKACDDVCILRLSKIKQVFSENTYDDSCPLGDISMIRAGSGFPHKYQDHKEGRYPFFKVSDMNNCSIMMDNAENYIDEDILNEIGAKAFPPNTLVFPKVGAAINTNKKRLLTNESLIDNNVMGISITNRKRLVPKYLYYFFESFDLGKLVNPGAVPSISSATVKSLELSLPDIEEQEKVIKDLDGIETSKMEITQMIDRTNQLRQAIINQILDQ